MNGKSGQGGSVVQAPIVGMIYPVLKSVRPLLIDRHRPVRVENEFVGVRIECGMIVCAIGANRPYVLVGEIFDDWGRLAWIVDQSIGEKDIFPVHVGP